MKYEGVILTYTQLLDLLNFNETNVNIEDIAQSLSKMCRWNGHTKKFYSVAQHSYVGAKEIYTITNDKKKSLAFLLHDASEAYLSDIARPLKALKDFKFYNDLESKIQQTIETYFNINLNDDIIKQYDDIMLQTELRDVVKHHIFKMKVGSTVLKQKLYPDSYKRAYKKFIEQFNFYTQ